MFSKKREPSSFGRTQDAADYNNEKDEIALVDVGKNDQNIKQQDSEIDLESLVAAPMIAVSKANATMLSGQVQFILDYCFRKVPYELSKAENNLTIGSDCYEAIMISIVVMRPNIEEKDLPVKSAPIESIVPIPIISLLPINSIGIDKMKVDFSMEITSISSAKDHSQNPQNRKSSLSGKLGGDKSKDEEEQSKSNKSIDVSVEATKLPLPNGLLNIIELFSKI